MAGTIDAVTGAPLVQDIDLELPFGTAVFRHVRTYSELPGVGVSELPTQCYGAGGSGMLAGETFWDWHGQGWMMGENPLFLIDATYWASVYPTGTQRCYFMPDAHHAIPFVFSPDLGEYTAPPQFDALLEHDGTWDQVSGSWFEWDGQVWHDNRPRTFHVWLQNRSVRYTIKALYEDAGLTGTLSANGYPTSRHEPPAAVGPGSPHPGGEPSGLGTPYYGLCTAIDDRYGNRVQIEYCEFRRTGCSHESTPECEACCQSCHEKGQIRRVRLLAGVDLELESSGTVQWTLVYVHRPFDRQQDTPSTNNWHTPQTAVASIIAYPGNVELWDPNAPGELLSCLTFRGDFAPFAEPQSCDGSEGDRWSDLTAKDSADELEFFGLPDNWQHRIRYLYFEKACAFDDPEPAEHVDNAYPHWQYDTGRLIKVSRTSRDTDAEVPQGEPLPETTVHTLYRYDPRPWFLIRAGFQPDDLMLSAAWYPETINAIREGIEHPDMDPTERDHLLEQWPLRLLRKNPVVFEAPYPVAAPPQLSQGEFLPPVTTVLAYRPLLELADLRFIRWRDDEAFQDYATSGFAQELVTEFLALPNSDPGMRPVALQPGYAEFVDRRGAETPRRFRVFQFLNTPERDQPAHGGEVVLYQGMGTPQEAPLAPFRSLLHYPYVMLTNRNGFSETPDLGGEYASVVPLDTPMWITVVDEYAAGYHASDSPSPNEPWIGQYEIEISGLHYALPDTLDVPLTRRVVMMNAAGYILKDRTWDIRSGEITSDDGLMISYLYETGTLDPNGNGQVDPDESDLPTIRVKEKRSLGWSAANLEGIHADEGLVTVYDYDDSAGWSMDIGAVGVRRGGAAPEDQVPPDPGPVTWISQYIRDRESDRPDLVRYELGFFLPRDTLLSYDVSFDEFELLDPTGVGPGISLIAHDIVLAAESDSWLSGKVLSENTIRSGAKKSPGSLPYLSIDRMDYVYEPSWTHQFRTYGTSTDPEFPAGDDAEIFVDYALTDAQGHPRLRVSDVDVDGNGVVIDIPSYLVGVDSSIDSPDGLERDAEVGPLNHWIWSQYSDRGLTREESHQGLRTEVVWKLVEEPVGEGPEVSLIEEQWIFKDIAIVDGIPNMGDAIAPGEINRFYAGRLLKSGRYLWPSEGQGVDPYTQEQVELLSELVPLYDSSGRMNGLDAAGAQDEDPVQARIAYDAFGAVNRERHPDGTVVRNVSDPLGRPERVYRGTIDLHEYWGTGTPGEPGQWHDNLVLVEKRYYSDGTPADGSDEVVGGPNDAGQVLGIRRLRAKPSNQYELYDENGDLIAPSSEDEDGFLERFGYDWRMRHVWTQRLGEDPDGPGGDDPAVLTHTLTWLDNLDRVRFVATYGSDAPNDDPDLDPRLLDQTCAIPADAQAIISGHTVGGQGLRRLSETIYNSRGQVEEQREYDVSDNDGDSYLSTLTYYDHADRPIWTRQPNGLIQRTVYDALGRQVFGVTSVIDEFNDETVLSQTLTTYDLFGHVAAIETRERLHDADPGTGLDATNSVASYAYQYHDRDGRLLSTVDLGTGSDDDQFVETASVPARPAGFGPNGALTHPRWVHDNGWELDTQGLPEWVKVTSYEYDREGRQVAVMHPDGSRTTNLFDSLGQLVLMAENVTASAPQERRRTAYKYEDGRLVKIAAILEGPSTPTTSQEVGFVFEFDDGSAQITEFRYGADIVERDPTTGAVTIISRNGAWIGSVHFPDTTTGQPAEDPDLTFQYYPDGLLATRTDARGVVFTHLYDALGNRVQTLADMSGWTGDTGPGDRIDRIDFAYDLPTGELLDSLASTNGDPQEIVAHTRYAYDPRGNLLKEIQQHGQAIDEQDPDASAQVLYAWEFAGAIPNQTGGPQNFDRLESMAYPVRPGGTDRRTVSLQYGAAAADIDDLASRITRITDDELTAAEGYEFLAAYAYAGSMRRVIQTYGYGQNGTPSDESDDTIAGRWLAWDAHDPTGPPPATPAAAPGDGYPALDRFGRTTTLSHRGGAAGQNRALQWSASYGYDAADSRAWQRIGQQDPLNPGTLFDNTRSSLFAYDGLRRLTGSELGELDFTDPDDPEIDSGTTRRTIAWDLDSLGNWSGHTTGLYDPPGTLDDTVEADQLTDLRNELVGIDPGTPSDPQDDEAIISDPLGSIVADDAHFYEYDGWGRLVQVSERGSLAFDADGAIASGTPGQWLIHFTYDGLGRLIRTQRPRPGTGGQQPTEVITHQFYYDGVRRVQDIETLPVQASGGGPLPIGQQGQWSLLTRLGREYIHSPGYVDEFVCSVDRLGAPAFILQDANYNVIALTDATGAVLAQYTWDPYGQLIDEQRATAPFADNAIGHQGLFFDRLNGDGDDPPLVAGSHGVYYARNRSLSTRFGRWLQADPNGTGLGVASTPTVFGNSSDTSIAIVSWEDTFVDGANRFSAVGLNPSTLTDPMGLFLGYIGITSASGLRSELTQETLFSSLDALSMVNGFFQAFADRQEAYAEWASDLSLDDDLFSQDLDSTDDWEVGLEYAMAGRLSGAKTALRAASSSGRIRQWMVYDTYSEARRALRAAGLSGKYQVHHIVEARHLKRLGRSTNGPGVVLTREQHLIITNRLRKEMPYGRPYSVGEIKAAYQKVYADRPKLLAKALSHLDAE